MKVKALLLLAVDIISARVGTYFPSVKNALEKPVASL